MQQNQQKQFLQIPRAIEVAVVFPRSRAFAGQFPTLAALRPSEGCQAASLASLLDISTTEPECNSNKIITVKSTVKICSGCSVNDNRLSFKIWIVIYKIAQVSCCSTNRSRCKELSTSSPVPEPTTPEAMMVQLASAAEPVGDEYPLLSA